MSSFTDQQIDRAAAAAAEKANGGRFLDPLFYAPEHRQFWRDVVKAALDAGTAQENSETHISAGKMGGKIP